jgi:hypothetical protein
MSVRSPRETAVPKDGGSKFKIQSPHGNVLAETDSLAAAASLASMFGSYTEVWLHGERLGTYYRGYKGRVTRSESRRRFHEIVAGAAPKVEARVRAYKERMIAAFAPSPVAV